MAFDKATRDVAQALTSGADLDELRDAAQDLRALSPDSALAQLVEEKIERLEDEISEHRRTTHP